MDHLIKAWQLLANARQLLTTKTKLSGRFYRSRKPIQKAGKLAWRGVIEALEGAMLLHGFEKRRSLDRLTNYNEFIEVRDKTKLPLFENAYFTLCRSLGQDGNRSVVIVNVGIEEAEELITWCEQISLHLIPFEFRPDFDSRPNPYEGEYFRFEGKFYERNPDGNVVPRLGDKVKRYQLSKPDSKTKQ